MRRLQWPPSPRGFQRYARCQGKVGVRLCTRPEGHAGDHMLVPVERGIFVPCVESVLLPKAVRRG